MKHNWVIRSCSVCRLLHFVYYTFARKYQRNWILSNRGACLSHHIICKMKHMRCCTLYTYIRFAVPPLHSTWSSLFWTRRTHQSARARQIFERTARDHMNSTYPCVARAYHRRIISLSGAAGAGAISHLWSFRNADSDDAMSNAWLNCLYKYIYWSIFCRICENTHITHSAL